MFVVATIIYMLSGIVTYCMMCAVSKPTEHVAQREYYFVKHVAQHMRSTLYVLIDGFFDLRCSMFSSFG